MKAKKRTKNVPITHEIGKKEISTVVRLQSEARGQTVFLL
jgi:hypothetical protein